MCKKEPYWLLKLTCKRQQAQQYQEATTLPYHLDYRRR